MTFHEIFRAFTACKNQFTWEVKPETGRIRGRALADSESTYCPWTALAMSQGHPMKLYEYHHVARLFHVSTRNVELVTRAADAPQLEDDSKTAAIRARLLTIFGLEEVAP